jgi:hypothetical protein
MEQHYGAIVSCGSDLAPSPGRLTRIKQDLMLLQSILGNAGKTASVLAIRCNCT